MASIELYKKALQHDSESSHLGKRFCSLYWKMGSWFDLKHYPKFKIKTELLIMLIFYSYFYIAGGKHSHEKICNFDIPNSRFYAKKYLFRGMLIYTYILKK